MTNIFNAEWERLMSDYDSDYVYLLPIKFKTKEIYYENITQVPARLRGAYIIDEESKNKIDFEILDPDKQRVYFNSSHQCIFDVTVSKIGKYMITFHNKNINPDLKVTFTMSTGQNVILNNEDLTLTEQKIYTLMAFIKKFNAEFKSNRHFHQERYKSKSYLYIINY